MCANNLWGAIQIGDVHNIPHVKNRIATEQDVIDGTAVFYIQNPPNTHFAIDIKIPSFAHQLDTEADTKKPVVIIQAENVDGKQLVGVRYMDGGNGICPLSELETE